MIPMADNLPDLEFILGDAQRLTNMAGIPAREPFSADVLAFIATFSQCLLRQPEAKSWSDVVSLAFWCRPAALRQLQNDYPDLKARQGRGMAFHIAPSNVAVNFAYSLLVGLLTGNANVVRLPGKTFTQVEIICRTLFEALNEHPDMAAYIVLLRYDKQKVINDYLSLQCQTRIVWGGDQTVATLRQSPLPVRALDIAFANRHSFALIDAQGYLEKPDKKRIALDFYNDTLQSDQNACSSPGLVVWVGGNASVCEQARQQFWQEFDTIAAERYTLQAVSAVEKLSAFCQLSAKVPGVIRQPVKHNRLVRVELPQLQTNSMDYTGRCGYFLEYQAENVDEILPLCGSACQTIVFCGMSLETIESFLAQHRPAGVDRVVPFGQALNFTLKWDGYDLVYLLTRSRAL